jgi:predicted  nucleic acid-binding Zn ribbon protein
MAKTDFEREETRRFREMRREIIKLRKENAQLRKLAHQLEQQLYNSSSEDEDELQVLQESVDQATQKNNSKTTCPKCGSYAILEFRVMDRPYFKCNDCLGKGFCNSAE